MIRSGQNSKVLSLLLSIFLSSALVMLYAQQSSTGAEVPMSTHVHSAPQSTIDGAQHPELIPDSSAYRLVFVVLGLPSDATDDQKQLQAVRLHNGGFSQSDAQAATRVLNSFKVQYSDMINSFNDSAHQIIVNGGTPDLQSLDSTRDALVQTTRDALKQVLSPQGMAALDRFVQREKTKMRVPAQ